ncbi:MAG TPA: hypothetical protein VFG07_03575 [Thermoplasmata archaeon]|nr:hypothetical protein [Thermoplasmata archaeon]
MPAETAATESATPALNTGGSAPSNPETQSGPGGYTPGSTGSAAGSVALPPPTLAPPSTATFDELAKRLPAAEPRRGSVMQPPPAWQPDEVTLGFAMIRDESGAIRELPEPIVLATILMAVETDRRRLLNRLTGGSDEEIVAVASLFWPLLVLPGRSPPEVAIFDGTGVWKRTFRYTLLPPLESVQSLLTQKVTPPEQLQRLRSLQPYFGHDPGAEVLTVEGFLPVDPPLLFDVLAQSEFRSDPQSPHSGFLPARHDVGWYHDVVRSMQQWLGRFEGDMKTLHALRESVRAVAASTQAELDGAYLSLQTESRTRVAEATDRADKALAELHATHRVALKEHATAIRQSLAIIAHGEAAVTTSETLSRRASHRSTDADAHVARGKHAEGQVRQAKRRIEDARRAMERIHSQERADMERIMGAVGQLEAHYAQRLAEGELFRDEFLAAAEDVQQAIAGQIAARTAQKNLLEGYFLPLPSLADVRVVWFPLWTASLRSPRGLRQLVFPPMQVRAHTGLGGKLKQLFGGVVLPLEPRTAQFDRVLRTTMEESLATDPWLSAACQELTRASDVLADPDVLQRLEVGLQELKRAGWISRKQEQDVLATYLGRSRRQVDGLPPTAPPMPPGATSEPLLPGSPGGVPPPPEERGPR